MYSYSNYYHCQIRYFSMVILFADPMCIRLCYRAFSSDGTWLECVKAGITSYQVIMVIRIHFELNNHYVLTRDGCII